MLYQVIKLACNWLLKAIEHVFLRALQRDKATWVVGRTRRKLINRESSAIFRIVGQTKFNTVTTHLANEWFRWLK